MIICRSVTGSTLETAIASQHEAEAKLKRIVRERFREAAENRDSASIERFFKLFALLDMQTEGLDTFAAYVRDELQRSAHSLLEPVLLFEPSSAQPEPAEKPSSVFFADLLNLVLTCFSSSGPVNCCLSFFLLTTCFHTVAGARGARCGRTRAAARDVLRPGPPDGARARAADRLRRGRHAPRRRLQTLATTRLSGSAVYSILCLCLCSCCFAIAQLCYGVVLLVR